MVPRDAFINKIRRDLDYSYKDTQKRTFLYRKKGGTHYISVPRADMLEDEYVTSTLRQAGCKEEEIKTFLAIAKC